MIVFIFSKNHLQPIFREKKLPQKFYIYVSGFYLLNWGEMNFRVISINKNEKKTCHLMFNMPPPFPAGRAGEILKNIHPWLRLKIWILVFMLSRLCLIHAKIFINTCRIICINIYIKRIIYATFTVSFKLLVF